MIGSNGFAQSSVVYLERADNWPAALTRIPWWRWSAKQPCLNPWPEPHTPRSSGVQEPLLRYEFTERQVTLCGDGLPARTVWLVMKCTVGEHASYWYYISNAPLSTRLPLFVWLSGLRWAIEQCFEEAKTALGMDQYEVRQYPGWHHHMLTTMLAHFFLWHLQIRLGEKSTSHYGVPAEDPVGGGVALKKLDD